MSSRRWVMARVPIRWNQVPHRPERLVKVASRPRVTGFCVTTSSRQGMICNLGSKEASGPWEAMGFSRSGISNPLVTNASRLHAWTFVDFDFNGLELPGVRIPDCAGRR